MPLTCVVRGWLLHERCAGKQGRCGTRGSRISAPRFARGKGDAATPEISFGARGYAAAVTMRTGFRDVFTCTWPISSYSVSGLFVVFQVPNPLVRLGMAELGLGPN